MWWLRLHDRGPFNGNTGCSRWGMHQTHLFRSALSFILPLALSGAALAATPTHGTPMKTVCTMTLNSSDEAETFRAQFSPKLWNFVELTEGVQPGSSNWFPKVCAKQISCDVLVVSGHFGGSFFGESQLSLSMEDLENASCDATCRGIMEKPKDVFLFGCNTLASKERDTRTPEQYRDVLLADGFSQSQAAEIVAFRYSALGDSFKDRMSQAFSNSPRIFGFSALAPSGKNTQPRLSRYLKSAATRPAIERPALFKRAFSDTTAEVVPGSQATFKPYCYLRDEKIERLEKIRFVKKSLEEGRAFGFISHISGFAKLLESAEEPEELHVLSEIRASSKIATEFEKFMRLKGDVYIPVRLSVLGLMKSFGMISPERHGERALSELKVDITRPLSREFDLAFCTRDLHSDLAANAIPESRWEDDETLAFLRCLEPQNRDIQARLVDIFLNAKHHETSFAAGYALEPTNVRDIALLGRIVTAAESHPKEEVRHQAIDLLGVLRPQEVNLQRRMARLARTSPDDYTRSSAANSLGSTLLLTKTLLHPLDAIALTSLRDAARLDPEFGVRQFAEEGLRQLELAP
jgi:hypothetical protein